jgi:hypothetical protein
MNEVTRGLSTTEEATQNIRILSKIRQRRTYAIWARTRGARALENSPFKRAQVANKRISRRKFFVEVSEKSSSKK